MKKNNPFNITFGKYPSGIIKRNTIFEEIFSSFDNKETGMPLYILVGARGCGKTVTMTVDGTKTEISSGTYDGEIVITVE